MNDLERSMVQWNSFLLLRLQRETIVKEACNYITYQNHGTQTQQCIVLLDNPYMPATYLTTHKYDLDMCDCANNACPEKQVSIPAMIRQGDQAIPAGVIDLLALYATDAQGTFIAP